MKRILSLTIGLAFALSYSPLQAGHGHGGGGCYGGHYHGGCGSGWSIGFSPGLFWNYPAYTYYPSYTYSYYRPRYYPVHGYAYDYHRPATYARPSVEADVQIALARRGFYYGNIDGIIGSQSRNAIRRYQVRYGLPVTGAIDYPLVRSLALR